MAMMQKLELPRDPNSELFFDAKKLVVGFRSKTPPPSEIRAKVLRVVVQCFGWVIEDRFFPANSVITVGADKRNTFKIPTKDLADHHPLIEYGADRSVRLSVNAHFSGVLQVGDQLQSLSTVLAKSSGPVQAVTLPKGSRGCLELGTLRIYFEEISDPEKVVPVAIFKNLVDPYLSKWILVSTAIHLLLLIGIKILSVMAPPKADIKLEDLSPQFQKIIVSTQQIKPYKPMNMASAAGLTRGKVGMEGEGERAAGAEGRRGKGIQGAGSHRMTGKDIQKTGLLDVFSRRGKGNNALAELLGGGSGIPGSVDTAFNRAARYGLPGERELREGKGLKGTGTGGGGLSTSIGQGLGTKGKGGGARGPGLADFGTGRSDTAVSASIDEEEVFIMGNIPKEVIAKIMADHMGEVRFCYERQLTVQPNLRGKVVTNFVIGLEGNVTSTGIKQSTLGNPTVEQCIQNVIRRIKFPKPGGGIVEVIYPYVFRVAG